MTEPAHLSLAELVVLTVVDEAPTHGFAVASLTTTGGELGRVWQIPRPVIYRSLNRLEALGLVEPHLTEPGRGPQRQLFATTRLGGAAVSAWLRTPVAHIRDIRSHLLLKLALLDRRGVDPQTLLREQRQTVVRIVAGLQHSPEHELDGFPATLVAWRRANASAVLTFLDDLIIGGS